MSDSMARLRRKISTASDLQSVVRTMKAMAASSVEQYERSVLALMDYYRTIELGLSACFREHGFREHGFPAHKLPSARRSIAEGKSRVVTAIVFGSDQGLVGRFNDVVADFCIETLTAVSGAAAFSESIEIWAVGERVHGRLADSGLALKGLFHVPNSVQAIAPLVGQLQAKNGSRWATDQAPSVYVFHNKPQSAAQYEPVSHRLLPLDTHWLQDLTTIKWPAPTLPQVKGTRQDTLRALVREYLFISIYRACAESLASENAARLSAMQRAEKNIEELLEDLFTSFHRLRQGSIDEELFDVVAGFEALSPE